MIDADIPRQRGRILIVDDETNVVKTFRYCLEDAGYGVSSARNAAEATALVQQGIFDLCFLDLRLGDQTGLTLLPLLRDLAPWMKIVIVTAYSSIESAVEAIQLGVVSRNRRKFRHPNTNAATIASRSISLPSLWNV
jgi:NtrC-family two-component system response regulator AlgB